MILFNSLYLNSLFGRVVLLEFISNLCNHHFVKFQDDEAVKNVKVIFEAVPTKLSYAELATKGSLLPLIIL